MGYTGLVAEEFGDAADPADFCHGLAKPVVLSVSCRHFHSALFNSHAEKWSAVFPGRNALFCHFNQTLDDRARIPEAEPCTMHEHLRFKYGYFLDKPIVGMSGRRRRLNNLVRKRDLRSYISAPRKLARGSLHRVSLAPTRSSSNKSTQRRRRQQ